MRGNFDRFSGVFGSVLTLYATLAVHKTWGFGLLPNWNILCLWSVYWFDNEVEKRSEGRPTLDSIDQDDSG